MISDKVKLVLAIGKVDYKCSQIINKHVRCRIMIP